MSPRVRCLAAVVLAAAGCSKCRSNSSAPDATPHHLRQIDVRSALMVVFPEYRGAVVTEGAATVTRTVEGPLERLAEASLTRSQFVRSADGASWGKEPFVVRVHAPAISIEVPLDPVTVEKVFSSPNSLSTLDLAAWLPKDPALRTEREVFELTLGYDAMNEGRAAFLVRQLVRLLLGNSQWSTTQPLAAAWDTDAGFPEVFEATLREAGTGAVVWARRQGRSVKVRYTLLTNEP